MPVPKWNQAMLMAQSLAIEPVGVELGVAVVDKSGVTDQTKMCSLEKQKRWILTFSSYKLNRSTKDSAKKHYAMGPVVIPQLIK